MRAQLSCVDFRSSVPGDGPNPRSERGFRFLVFDSSGSPEPNTQISSIGGFIGLNCRFRAEVRLPDPASMVEVTTVTGAAPPVIEAFDASGALVDSVMGTGGGTPETIRLTGDGIVRIVITAPQNELILLELCSIACPDHAATHGCCCCCCCVAAPQDTDITGLVIHIRTLNENLDIRTWVEADVFQGTEPLVRGARVASGEVEEFQDHAPAPIPFDRPGRNPTGLSILLRHPGIPSNSDPHWRMRFTLEAITARGQRRACLVTMQSAANYDTDLGGHLNFEGAARESGRMPFLINF
jgi:hypothetical protein